MFRLEYQKCNNQMYLATEKRELDNAATRVLSACASAKGVKDGPKHLAELMTMLNLRSSAGQKSVRDEFSSQLTVLKTLGDGDEGRSSVEVLQSCGHCITTAKDMRDKMSFEKIVELAPFPTLVKLEEAQVGSKKLIAAAADMGSIVELMEKAQEVAELFIKARAGGDVCELTQLLPAVTVARAKMSQLTMEPEAAEMFSDFEKVCNVGNVGCQAYDRKLKEFKVQTTKLVRCLATFACDDSTMKEAAAELLKRHDAIRSEEHLLRQLGAWSSTVDHDTGCINLVTGILADFSKHAPMAVANATTLQANYKPSPELMTAMSKLLQVDVTKPKLEWLTSSEDAAKLIDRATEIKKKLEPLFKRNVDSMRAAATKLQGNLAKLLAPADAGEEDFYKFYTLSKLNTLKALRAKLKSETAELKIHIDAQDPKLKEMQDVAMQARLQTTRWTMMSFTKNTDIRSLAKFGADLRASLRAAWGVNATNEEVTKYLGEGFIKVIEEILAVKDVKAAGKGSQDVDAAVDAAAPDGKGARKGCGRGQGAGRAGSQPAQKQHRTQ